MMRYSLELLLVLIMSVLWQKNAQKLHGFSLSPNIESWIPLLAVGTPTFQRNLAKLRSGTPTCFEETGLGTSVFKI